MTDYYENLDEAIRSYEEHKPYHQYTTDYITDRITWCWKWRKITAEQLNDLTSRMIKIFQEKLIK